MADADCRLRREKRALKRAERELRREEKEKARGERKGGRHDDRDRDRSHSRGRDHASGSRRRHRDESEDSDDSADPHRTGKGIENVEDTSTVDVMRRDRGRGVGHQRWRVVIGMYRQEIGIGNDRGRRTDGLHHLVGARSLSGNACTLSSILLYALLQDIMYHVSCAAFCRRVRPRSIYAGRDPRHRDLSSFSQGKGRFSTILITINTIQVYTIRQCPGSGKPILLSAGKS
jgi:hypothetical protein